jgi:hypothetical protein
MKILKGQEQAYADWSANNSDPYGAAVFRYAETWANMMEAAIQSGEKIELIADKLSHDADTEGITGYMYGAAVAILSKCWEHGEALRVWHNLKTQIGNEGEKANANGGVLNPAILNIGS